MSENNHVSVTVPYDYTALINASNMLKGIAKRLAPKEDRTGPNLCSEIPAPKVLTEADALADLNGEPRPDNPSPEATAMQEQEAKEVFAAPVTPLVNEVADSSGVAPEYARAEPVPTPVTPPPPAATPVPAAPVDPVAVTPPNAPSELDANSLPWDERIHAKTKTKDVKGKWKYLRGVDKVTLVPQVEAELRAMVGEPTPVAVTPPPPAAAPVPAPAPETPPAHPAAEVTPSISVTTFAQLVTAITEHKIPEDEVNTALAAVGVQSLALLGAKADLIPTVAGHLGL